MLIADVTGFNRVVMNIRKIRSRSLHQTEASKSPASSETRFYDFFGKTYKTRNTFCSQDGVNYEQMPEKLHLPLTICPTSYCDASCRFCIAKNTGKKESIDLKKLENTLERLKKADAVSKVFIKGGEPFYDVGLLDDVLKIVFDIFGNSLYVSVTTNGNNLKRIYNIKTLENINRIHISRHHYNDEVNNMIFGKKMISSDDIRQIAGSFADDNLFVYNCMLLKDFINSTKEAHRFMNFAIDTCVKKVAFMSCVPINEYAEKQFVHFSEVFRKNDPDILFTNGFCDYNFCRCISGIYLSPQVVSESFYARYTNTEGCDYLRGFVFGTDNVLRSDFSGDIIETEDR